MHVPVLLAAAQTQQNGGRVRPAGSQGVGSSPRPVGAAAGTTAFDSSPQTVQALPPLVSLNPAQAERMPGRIRVDLEVVHGVDVLGWL